MNETDEIRVAIVARAEELGLTAYAIAKALSLDPQTVKRYFAGSQSLRSVTVSAVVDYLDLEVKPRPRSRSKRAWEYEK